MRRSAGFTIIEIAIVLVIIGLLVGGILKGLELITSARVRTLIVQQGGVKAAFLGFQDRFHAFPGDYTAATTNIIGVAATAACGNGNGNGNFRIEITNNENVLAWEHLSKSGFLTGTYTCTATEDPTTSPTNPYGIYMQLVFDGIYGAGTTAAPSPLRHNIKTGSQVPVEIIAEMDRKIDDGEPNSGGIQFSRYQGNGTTAPTDGATAQPACTSDTSAAAVWNATNGSTNCGGASLL